jgi:beta-lactamase class A
MWSSLTGQRPEIGRAHPRLSLGAALDEPGAPPILSSTMSVDAEGVMIRTLPALTDKTLLSGLALLSLSGAGCAGDSVQESLAARLTALVDTTSGGDVSVYYRSLGGPDSALVNADVRMHAASTMKVPVLIQLVLDDAEGTRSLGDSIEVTDRFRSILDGSTYRLDPNSDSDHALYDRIGELVEVAELAELMITVSSNLATNLLIEEVGAERVTQTMRALGADSIQVLRGVEDIPAFEAGLSNTTTARDLGVIMAALAARRVGTAEACELMLDILSRQQFREMIPAGVPQGTRVANKDGWITEIRHDAAVVYPNDAPPYVLVVMTRGFLDPSEAEAAAVRISELVWDHHTQP